MEKGTRNNNKLGSEKYVQRKNIKEKENGNTFTDCLRQRYVSEKVIPS